MAKNPPNKVSLNEIAQGKKMQPQHQKFEIEWRLNQISHEKAFNSTLLLKEWKNFARCMENISINHIKEGIDKNPNPIYKMPIN